jgi:hypothetical protein
VINAGGAITANGGAVQMSYATIEGGTLNVLGGGTMETVPFTVAYLNGSTHGALTISAGSTYTSSNTATTRILGTIDDKGVIQVNGGGGTNGQLYLFEQTTLSGGGVVSLTTAIGGGNALIALAGSPLTNDDVIEGTGEIGNGPVTVINSGTIDADSSAGIGTLTLTGDGGVTNTGTLEATGGGHLDVFGAIGGAGQLKIGAGSEVELGSATSENSTFLGASNAKLRIDNATTHAYSGVVNSFVSGDILELGSTNATKATPTSFNGTNTTLTADLSSGGPLTYTLAGDLTADTFKVTHVNGDSDIAIKTTAAFERAHSLLWDPMGSSFVGSSDVMGGYHSRSAELDLAASTYGHAPGPGGSA